jgi:hypothetical protein
MRRVLRRVLRRLRGDAGVITAEYALVAVAAAGLAVVLYKVVTSGPVQAALQHLFERALQ